MKTVAAFLLLASNVAAAATLNVYGVPDDATAARTSITAVTADGAEHLCPVVDDRRFFCRDLELTVVFFAVESPPDLALSCPAGETLMCWAADDGSVSDCTCEGADTAYGQATGKRTHKPVRLR
jgi:hypothetical protein